MAGNTFPINKDDLPTLKTRRALLVIDLQNDFLSEGAPLHTAKPEGFVSRISSLVAAFRQTGDILWVRSEYKVKRMHQEDDIVVSDTPLMPLAARSRRRNPAQQPAAISDPEAFLSIDGPKKSLAVRTGTPGADFYSAIDPSIDKTRDRCFTKSHYSAFQSGELIKLLRTRFVTELFLVGSLVNVGVFATAVDAASHGYEITIVEDCCGFRSAARQLNALRRVVELTGCDVVPASDVVVKLKPKAEEPKQAKLLDAKPTSQADNAAEQDALSSGLQKLNLENDDEGKSGEGVAGKAQPDKSPDAGTPSIQPQKDEDNSSKTFDENPSDGKLESDKNTSAHNDSNKDGADSQEIDTIIGEKVPAEQTAVDQKDIKQIQADIRDTTPPSSTLQAKSTPNTTQPTPDTTKSTPGTTQPTPDTIKPAPSTAIKSTPDTKPTSDTTKSSLETTIKYTPDTIQSTPDTTKSTPDTTKPTPETTTKPTPETTQPIPETTTKPTLETTQPTPDTTERTLDTIKPSKSKDIPTATKPSVLEVKPQQKTATVPMEARTETPEPICEGDTSLIRNILPVDQADGIFEKLKSEVEWAHMSHQGGEVPRLVAVQGEVAADGSQPVYRHPSDESPPLHPFSPTVRFIKEKVEKELNHPLNHVLIQWYRNGHDYINEHSDKTLDIAPGSYITNVSLGAQRTMVLRTKRNHGDASTESPKPTDLKRNTVRVPLSHNSLFRMGLKTNEKWLHGIRQDKRLDREKTEPELAFDSARISLTFRHIGTFMDAEGKLIWGQGATSKTKEGAKQVINGQTPEAIKMLQGFGTENHYSIFDWQKHYGNGFDVLHISASPRLFASSDEAVNHRVQFMLAELGINYARGSVASGSVEEEAKPEGIQIKFVDNDDEQSVVLGEAAIMLYLELVYNKDRCTRSNAQLSKELSRFNLAFELLRWFRALEDKNENQGRKVKKALSAWNNYVTEEEQGFVAGKTITIADYAFFPALHHIREIMGKKVLVGGLEGLEKYYMTVRCRASSVKVMGPTGDGDAEKVVGEVGDKCSNNKKDDKNKSTMEGAVDDLSDLVKSRLVM